MKTKALSFRIEEDTYNYLADLADKSKQPMSEVVRGILENNQMTEGTRRAYGECLTYLASIDSDDFLVALDALIEAIKEVKTNG
ncbi:hypothetical protein [Nostoc sp. ChiSLP03a]|uniref:hypothetical protein n=1 Tax=Nostoc sp. ChiSLP03a TaxID=3075380 RepID=UPI002AD5700E|nr:hypothetical protein [Nostoc sp. ChiSLP03a]MDZ8211331.1 hypothetical protein [Nostoc sp. ChiSLP03a]